MFAVLLALAGCNKAETDFQPEEKAEGITITATLAAKTAPTKAVADNGDNIITATWAKDEKIAILYEVSETKHVAQANVDAVDGESGVATISFTVVAGTPDRTPCTLVYPASAARKDHTGVKDAAELLSAQDGTLNANLDVRVGDGTLNTSTPGLDVSTQPVPQFAIFNFTAKNTDGSATVNVKPLTITIGAQNYVITPASATSTLYAALPAISSQAVSFSALSSDSRTYEAAYSGISFTAGYFYRSVLKMTGHATSHAISSSVVGDVVGSDGLAYAAKDKDDLPQGVTAVGMVASRNGKSGLVIALADDNVGSGMTWNDVNGQSGVSAHSPAMKGYTWRLPSREEWNQVFEANGGSQTSGTGLNTALVNAGGAALLSKDYYWSSSPGTESGISVVEVSSTGNISWAGQSVHDPYKDVKKYVRACFVFNPEFLFSVSSTTKVQFAPGNLTYSGSKWEFLSNSWEYTLKLEGGNVRNKTAGSQYFDWPIVFKGIDSGVSEVLDEIASDLGSASWRALSTEEWRYLMGYDSLNDGVQYPSRTVAWHRYAAISGAQVGEGYHLLIFPDTFKETDWTDAMGTKPSLFESAGTQSIAYTTENFSAMQDAGILILPQAGYIYVSNYEQDITNVMNEIGRYWSSTSASEEGAMTFYFPYCYVHEVSVEWKTKWHHCCPVRLVQDK
jgi:hypothetical protein